jgi:hypothetical protein
MATEGVKGELGYLQQPYCTKERGSYLIPARSSRSDFQIQFCG